MRNKILKILFSSCLVPLFIVAQTADSVYVVAKHQYQHKNYSLSAQLFERIVYFDTTRIYSASIYPQLAEIYFRLNNLSLSNHYYDLSINNAICNDSIIQYHFRKIRNYTLSKYYVDAFNELEMVVITNNDSLQRVKWFLYGVEYFGMKNYDSSESRFAMLIRTTDTVKRQTLHKLFKDIKRNDRHNYKWAVAISAIIPGSGQMLLGHYKDGTNALLLTSAFTLLTVSTVINYSAFDGLISVFPWWLRYYRGNLNHAREEGIARKAKKRTAEYKKILTLIPK